MSARIAVIDDETQIRRMLRIALSSEGYEVSEADTAQKGITAILKQQPDLVVLDLGLPDLDGSNLLSELRSWSSIPVIVLSVRGDYKEKVNALDAGAQDYITKPFSMEEFLARIRAHLRDNLKPQRPHILEDGSLHIDLGRRLVAIDGNTVELTPKEYSVLSMLAIAPNCVITQAQLLQQIWGPTHSEDTHYLRIIISHLRQKLGDDPAEPHYIKTEPGVGYRLAINTRVTGTS